MEAQQETHAKTLREQLEALQAKHREATEAQAASQEEQKGAHARSLEVKGKELEAEHQVAMEQLEAKHEQAIQSVQEDNEKKLQEMTEKIEQLTNGLGEFEALFEEGDSSFLDQAETSLEGMLGYAKVADPILAQLPLVLKGEKPEQGEICKEVQPVYELYQALQQTTEKLRLKSKEVEDQKSAHDAELQKAKSNYDVELKAQELKLIQAHQKAMEEKKAELERVGQELAALRAQLEKKQEEMAASFEAQIAEKEQALKTLDQAMDALVKDPTEKVDVSEAMVPIFEKFRMLVDQKEKLKLQNHSLLSGLQRAAAANKLQEDLNFIVSKNRKKSSPEQQAIIREARQVHDEVKKLLICIGKCVEAETAVLKKIRAQRDVGLDLVKFRLGKKFKKGALPTQATYKELARSIISLWAVYMKAETKLKHQRTIVDKALGALAVN